MWGQKEEQIKRLFSITKLRGELVYGEREDQIKRLSIITKLKR